LKKRKLHGKITEEVYKKEVDRITYRDENNKKGKSKVKSNKKKYIIIMIIFILIGFILLLYINRYYLFGREYVYVDNLYNLKDPIQEKASGTKKITIDGENVFISRLYSYKIQARVIDTKQYIGFDLLNKLSPEDMGLAWDFMVEDRNIDKINCYSHSNRLLNYRIYDNSWLESAGGRERVNQRVSNNHLIPADKTVKGKLLSIKKGEYVELEGYLVTAYTTDSDSNIYWKSSDTRTDTGDGACEVIYVTDVKWLKQKK
jgi:hypothetical protein